MEDYDRLGYDFWAALNYNIGPDVLLFRDVEALPLEITGVHDECDWHWIAKLYNGKYAYVAGGCDYTGWDCRSNADAHVADDFRSALSLAPMDVLRVFEDMIEKEETVRTNTGGL